jgi:hypothetical protein
MADAQDNLLALQAAYANVYNELVKPDVVFVASQYFRRRWVPLLGPTLAWIIIALRQHCYWNQKKESRKSQKHAKEDLRDWCLLSQDELAAEVGISTATLKRALQHEYAPLFIIEVKHRYRYDSHMRKRVRQPSRYRIRMDDPLVPEDEALLKHLLLERLSGLNVDPENGQMDMFALIDHLSHTSIAELQSKGGKLEIEAPAGETPVQGDIDSALGSLVDRMSALLTGQDGPALDTNGQSAAPGAEDQPYADALFVPGEALRSFSLGQDQVLVPAEEGYWALPIAELVKRDIRAAAGSPFSPRSEAFFSTQHALGEGPDDWLPEEEARMDLRARLERELRPVFESLGAFSLEAALGQHFSTQLAAEFVSDKPAAELERIAGWVAYTRRAKNLHSPAGFLRTKIESDEYPPENV